MSNTVNLGGNFADGDLSIMISDLCQDAADEAYERGKERTRAAAKAAEQMLRQTSPKRTGKYARGWKAKFVETSRGFSALVANETKPSLTHLLEKGHMTRKGGRTKALPHILPAYEKAKRLMEEDDG